MIKQVIIKNEKMFRELHKKYITGTDLASIYGLNKYKSAIDVYEFKRNGIIENENIPCRVGKCVEPLIKDLFLEEILSIEDKNIELLENKKPIFYYDNEFYLGGTPDYIFKDYTSGLECKMTELGINSSPESIPFSHILQCNDYMYLLNVNHWYLAYLSHYKLIYFKLERSDKLIAQLLQDAKIFMENTRNGIMPEAQTVLDMAKLYTTIAGTTEIDETTFEVYKAWRAKKELQKALEAEIKELDISLRLNIEGGEIATYGDKALYSYKPQNYNNFKEKEFKKENAELYNKYCEQTSIRVLRNKLKDDL